jgi:hypothetical protein
MSEQNRSAGQYVSELSSMEEHLVTRVRQTADDVAHTECFDTEQRAEVYAILETLKSNTQRHQTIAALLTQRLQKPHA